MNEFFRLIGLECSESLHSRLETAFKEPEVISPEHYRVITPNWCGECPMLTGEGLCSLQLECGEDALPEVCRVYPRSLKRVNGRDQACCSGSCEAVIEFLIAQNKLSLQIAPSGVPAEIVEEEEQDLEKLSGRCIALLRNRRHPLSERIAGICDLLGAKTSETMPETDVALSRLMEAMDGMRQNSRRFSDELDRVLVEYAQNASGYAADIRAFESAHPEWQNAFENMLINHMLYMSFPNADPRIDPGRAAAGLCMVYAMMRLFCADTKDETALVDAMTCVFHLTEHSPFYYNASILVQDPRSLLNL